jgi:hypothetical protein
MGMEKSTGGTDSQPDVRVKGSVTLASEPATDGVVAGKIGIFREQFVSVRDIFTCLGCGTYGVPIACLRQLPIQIARLAEAKGVSS